MKYEEILPIQSKDDVVSVLTNISSTSDQKVDAILGAIDGIDDPEWLQKMCLDFIANEDYWVAKAAIEGLGSIARIFGTLDADLVKLQLKQVMLSRKDLVGCIENTLSDLNIFLK